MYRDDRLANIGRLPQTEQKMVDELIRLSKIERRGLGLDSPPYARGADNGTEILAERLTKNSGIGTEMMRFFLRENATPLGSGKYAPRTLHDFLDYCPPALRKKHRHLGLIARIYCQKLIADGFLYSVGFNPAQELPYSEQFFSYFFIDEFAEYGDYDFSVLGFPEIVSRFHSSVIKLTVISGGGIEETTGTGFLIEKNRLATAHHCLPENSTVSIADWDGKKHPIKNITTFGRPDSTRPLLTCRGLEDLAVIEFESDPFLLSPKFDLWGANILDDCLVMGYPNIAGFDFYQIAGNGQVINEHKSYARRQTMMFVDVRVKGGNSGGPVINRFGRVIGVVTNSESEEGEEALKELGYALATPAQTLLDLVIALEATASAPGRELFNIKFAPKNSDSIWIAPK